MTALATSHMPTVDTLVGGVSAVYGENPWAERSVRDPEKPARKNLSDPEQPWLRTVLQETKAVAALTEGWDSYEEGWDNYGARLIRRPARKNLSDPEQPWLRTVLQEIKAVAALTEGWDSYGAGPIRRDVLWYALRLMQSVMDDYPAPQLTPMSHEGVLLEWHRNGIHLEIEVENAGEAYVSYENEETGADDFWEVRADFTSLSEPLKAIAGQTSAASDSTS